MKILKSPDRAFVEVVHDLCRRDRARKMADTEYSLALAFNQLLFGLPAARRASIF